MASFELVALLVQHQSQPTPDVLNALASLMKAISPSGHFASEASAWFTPEGLKAIAAFISAIAWPALALLFITRFRPEIVRFLTRVRKMEAFGIKAEIEAELDKSAQDAAASRGYSKAPTKEELKRAEYVERLATPADIEIVRRQIDELATEYEALREHMPSGDSRTRRMEVVVSKMRTIGRAAYPLRHQLMESSSPGHRLQAVACLQVAPDFDLLDWLAERIRTEKPFLAYHAVVGLNSAASESNAAAHIEALERAFELARANASGLSDDTDRAQELAAFGRRVAALRSQA